MSELIQLEGANYQEQTVQNYSKGKKIQIRTKIMKITSEKTM